MRRLFAATVLFLCMLPSCRRLQELRVGSKEFTESVILGEIAILTAQDAGYQAVHLRALGGTRILWDALLKGDIDLYPEYTGTILHELLAAKGLQTESDLTAALAALDLRMSRSVRYLGYIDHASELTGPAESSDHTDRALEPGRHELTADTLVASAAQR